MARRDSRTGAARPWRLLTRALVVAGATVAGTSAAWLLSEPHADAVTMPSDVRPIESTVEATTTPGFSLGHLDPIGLVRSDAEHLLAAAEPVTAVLRDSSAQLNEVAQGTLESTSLSETVDSGLANLAQPLLSDGTSTTTPSPAVITPPGPQTPVLSATPAPADPEVNAPRRSTSQSVTTTVRRAPERPELPGFPGGSRPFHLPAPTGLPGCGGASDGSPHNHAALGFYPVEQDRALALASAPARDAACALTGVPEPQPGTTPD